MESDTLNTLAAFARETLQPAASDILKTTYASYCDGADIGIQTKSDNSPASAADREAENAIRTLIQAHYPAHGIWGEEYGTHQLDSDWVWILDPLDGTKEFLAKNPHHFGLLIGLFFKGRPVYGLIHDPISGETWDTAIAKIQTHGEKPLKDASITCTNRSMFKNKAAKDSLDSVLDAAATEHKLMNCIGFAKVAAGDIDIVIEADLNLHDIAATLPVLFASGARIVDFDGNDYRDYTYDFARYGQRDYDIIAGHDKALIDEILERIKA